MKPMPNFESKPKEIQISLGNSQHLDQLCQALEMIRAGKALPESSRLGDDLAALADVFNSAPTAHGETHWSALFYPSYSGNGGMLSLKEQIGNQTLAVSRDRRGALYNGTWMRLGENDSAVLLFDVVKSLSGFQLKVSGDDNEWNVPLGENLIGFEWATPADVLGFIPEWLAANSEIATPAPAPQPSLPAAAAPAPKPAPQPLPPTVLAKVPTWHVLVQPGGQTIVLAGSLSIGREQDNDLCLEDKQLSRHHAVIEAVDKGWQVRDLGSTNGTGVNGRRINAPFLLKAGDVIELGDIRLTLELG
jgi:hypothetical protein